MRLKTKISVTPKRIFIGILMLVFIGIAVALLVAYSGIYNIAASRGHPLWLEWFLTVGMRRSIENNSSGIRVPNYDSKELVPLAAAHFHTGCAVCHGAPGVAVGPVFDRMLPPPPPLRDHVSKWETHQLFWIVKHGLQYTGMPGWNGQSRDDEVWIMAGFLKELPELTEDKYSALAWGNARGERHDNTKNPKPIDAFLRNCKRCHGTESAPATSTFIPRLGGQKQAYLLRSLNEYHNNLRESGIMEPVVADIDNDDLVELANYFSVLKEPQKADKNFDPDLLKEGKIIAEFGDIENRLPACSQCHAASASQEFPKLNGQHFDYLVNQLLLWKRGGRAQTTHGYLMGFVTQRMSFEQINAVSAYYSVQPSFTPDENISNKALPGKDGAK